jgi:Flp pilus assembly protein TadG
VTRLFKRRRRTEAGYAAILVSLLVPTVFLGLAAVGVDTARWHLEVQRVQLAADAAALAGVPYLPQDMPNAIIRAKEVAKRNGYDDAEAGTTVKVTKGVRESQLNVTISATVANQFGQMIGVGSTVITRTAVADFTGPAPMGSPCNTFGTEPPSGKGSTSASSALAGGAPPIGSAIGATRPLNCPQNPMLWANVEGPRTGKVQGDRYGTLKCEDSGVDGCDSGRNNTEHAGAGYFWLVKVQQSMVGKQVSLQLYDPAFVRTGSACEESGLTDYGSLVDDMNPFARTDGKIRYAENDTIPSTDTSTIPFCNGDYYPGSADGGTTKMTTTFMVREQTDTQDPLKANVLTGCAKQFGSYQSNPTVDALRSSSTSYNSDLAEVFHNWVELCKFTPARAGDYYLHVRTNKHYSFSGTDLSRLVPSSAVSGLAQSAGDSTPQGGGSNSFAIRAVTPAGQERGVAVSGWDRMPIFANSEGATQIFNLIRVLPGAAGQSISFDFFDAGDAAGTATVKVMLPSDARTPSGATISTPFPGGCTSSGGSAGTTNTGMNGATCTTTLTRSNGVSRNNGKVQTMNIPIPSDYSCDAADFLKCWYRVEINFASGTVNDITTWDAEIVGDPVRLIE